MYSLLYQKLSSCLIVLSVLFSGFSFSFPQKNLPVSFSCNKKESRLIDNAFLVTIKDEAEIQMTAIASSVNGVYRKENQDRCVITERYVAVIDGRGSQGHIVAEKFADQLVNKKSVEEAIEEVKSQIGNQSEMGWNSEAGFSIVEFVTASNSLKIHIGGDCTVVIMPQDRQYQESELGKGNLPSLVSSYGGVMEAEPYFSLKEFLGACESEKENMDERYAFSSSSNILRMSSVSIGNDLCNPSKAVAFDHAMSFTKYRVCLYSKGIALHPYEMTKLVINETLEEALTRVYEAVEQRQGNVDAGHQGLAEEFGLQAYLEIHQDLDDGVVQAIREGWIIPHDKDHEDNMSLIIVDIDISQSDGLE